MTYVSYCTTLWFILSLIKSTHWPLIWMIFRLILVIDGSGISCTIAVRWHHDYHWSSLMTSNRSWCMGIKGEMSGTVCVTFTWDMYIYIYIWVLYSLCFFCCLFITVTWWYVWCFEWASVNQEEVQACLVTLWLFIISCYSLYKTTLGLLCSWFENNPHFHKYPMDFYV